MLPFCFFIISKSFELISLFNFCKNPVFLIGPEGDFSDREIEKVYQLKGKGVHLTHKRLRTETAGIFVVTSFFNAQNL